MRYKRPKYNGYKKFNRRPIPKAAIIIGIVVAVLVLAIVAAVIITSVVNSSNANKNEQLNVQIKEIQIARKPNKLSYYCGTSFDTTGLMVYSLTNGGDFTKVNLDECTITGFDSSVPVEKQTITVTYKEFSVTFDVTIKEEPTAVPMLESVAIETLPKTEYKLKEGLDVEGGVLLCTYTDGTTKKVDLAIKYISGFVPAMKKGVGEHELMVIYEENGVQATTTYKITISE